MTEKTANGPTELETFLPQDLSASNGITKYKVNKSNDLEAANGNFDPLKARDNPNAVSDSAALTHLLKASLGTGILSMPAAFQASGLGLGIFFTILVSLICTHCAYILVVCAHELYKKSGKTTMTFADVAEESCLRGPQWAKKFASSLRHIVLISLFAAYYLSCSCYTVITARNFNYVISYYLGYEIEIRITIAILLIPLIILVYVPNLKYLAPVSMVSNVFMAVGLGITFYYLVAEVPSFSERNMVADITTYPVFFSITIFAIEAIGVVMPLENNMKKPQHFIGLCGVLNQGMSGVTLVYMIIGFFGYLRYGDDIEGSVTYNLPREEYAAQIVNILIGLAVYGTFGLNFYICLEIVWNGLKERYQENSKVAEYVVRTVLVVICVALAIAVPTIIPFVSLIGAFCFSILGLLFPVFIEVLTFWDKGFGKFNWRIVKNVIVVIFGLFALVFGSKCAVQDIINMYSSSELTNSTLEVLTTPATNITLLNT